MAARGAVAAGHPLTAEAAGEVLRAGGNAFDAALAGLCAACVAEPVLASLGGGGFMLALPEAERPRLYDFFVQTPGRRLAEEDLEFDRIEVDFGSTTQAFHIGRGTAAVPGMVRGLFEVHAALGRMPLPEVVRPAVEFANRGIEISAYQAYLLPGGAFNLRRHRGEPCHLRKPAMHRRADRRRRASAPARARGHSGHARAGRPGGSSITARSHRPLVRDMAAGGQIRFQDLTDYRHDVREPLVLTRRTSQVLLNPPPSSGGVLIAFGLELLDSAEVRSVDAGSCPATSLSWRVPSS